MPIVMFIIALVVGGIVLSAVPVSTSTENADQPDYHYVPYAGAGWKA